MGTTRVALYLLIVLAVGTTAHAQAELDLLLDPEANGQADLGRSLDSDGEWAVTGTPIEAAVLLFRRDGDTWSVAQKLAPSEVGEPAFDFGGAVAIDGTTLVVGDESDSTFGVLAGSASVYELVNDTWVRSTKLRALPDGFAQTSAAFGRGVDIEGDVIVVMAELFDFTAGGSAYVYRRSGGTWMLEQRIRPDAGEFFKQYVSLSGNRIAIGGSIPGKGSSIPAVLIYELRNDLWSRAATVPSPEGTQQNRFAESLDLDGDRLAVGAWTFKLDPATPNNVAPGAAYVFDRDGADWPLTQRIMSDAPVAGAGFGFSLDLHGDELAIGAVAEDTLLSPTEFAGPGAVYHVTLQGGTWTQSNRLTYGRPAAVELTGWSVSWNDDQILAGNVSLISEQMLVGAVHVFEAVDRLPTWTSLGSARSGSPGVARLIGSGDLQPGSPVSLALSNALPGAPAFLIAGFSLLTGSDPSPMDPPLGVAFRGGVLLPAPDVVLGPLPVGPAGELLLAGTWPADVGPGVETLYQLWIADGGTPGGFASTNTIVGITP